jgi:hypothetical protein
LAEWVKPIQGIIIDVSIEINPANRPYRISLHEPPERRRIDAGAKIVKPVGFGIDAGAGVAERA